MFASASRSGTVRPTGISIEPRSSSMADIAEFLTPKGISRPPLFGDPRMNPALAWMVAIFWIGVRGVDGFGIPDCRNRVRGSHLAIFPDVGTHSSNLLALNARPSRKVLGTNLNCSEPCLGIRWWAIAALQNLESANVG